jgi:hypothetical protein
VVGTSPLQVGEAFATALGAELSLKIQIVGVQANGDEMVRWSLAVDTESNCAKNARHTKQ